MNLVEREHVVVVVIDVESGSVPAAVDASTNRTTTIDDKKDKRKHTSWKKAPKPPRPPRALSLDAADHKLIKEISMLKRARRIQTIKKMKAPNTAGASTSLYATLVTILFCLVILFQGLVSKDNSQVNFSGSPPESAIANNGVDHVQYYKKLSGRSSD